MIVFFWVRARFESPDLNVAKGMALCDLQSRLWRTAPNPSVRVNANNWPVQQGSYRTFTC